MAPSFSMRLSKAEATPSQSCRSPVKDSAHHSLRNTKQRAPHSESHDPPTLTQAVAELELSNFSLSLAKMDDVSTNRSRLPVSSFAPALPQPRHRPNPKGYRLSLNGQRLSQHSQSPGLAPRRDSVHRSSTGSVTDDADLSFRKFQSTDCDSGAVNAHADIATWSNAQKWGLPSKSAKHIDSRHTASAQLDDDTTAGAEPTQQWENDEVCFI
jgi:hypothetical protein